ncbi:hypothetical protein ACTJLB_29400 [Paraburkholderia sp. 22098]|uniref:hypothetical protein n=1 Tax=Paraburkholderia sp. 22098 TaxID=3453874 RepID=UPI003F84D6F2
MPILGSGNSLVLDMLRFFRDRIESKNVWTLPEIRESLFGDWSQWPFIDEYGTLPEPFFDDGVDEVIGNVLDSLSELGLVAIDSDYEATSGFPRWRLADSWQPPKPPKNDDGGRRGNSEPPGGGDDGDGGGGLREVLGHPVLFALDEGDFDRLIGDLFDEVRL